MMGEANRRRPPAATRADTLIISGAGPEDETYSCDKGMWNVTRALADCEAGRVGGQYLLDTAEAMAANFTVTVDPAKVARFRGMPEVLARPGVAVIVGYIIWLIDGHHRLRARAANGEADTPFWVIEAADEPRYRVRLLQQHPDGSTVDVTLNAMWRQDRA